MAGWNSSAAFAPHAVTRSTPCAERLGSAAVCPHNRSAWRSSPVLRSRSAVHMTAPQATQDKVVLKKLVAETQSSSGLVLSENAQNLEKFGEVVSIGAGKFIGDGSHMTFGIEVGDVVLYDSYTIEQVKVDNVQYTIIPISDIRAKLT
ncbi:10 kDa chaperonin [Porphyridium purpureum]|uniref:20 kDa chaperonin, chloroplastic n=1 Tax=Porphyridium purpureum TaxID=35688 RepID=A0A5J4YQD5_PORPP|nr:10 kDa chaperonin [Porphyridium purpureum]|eukprot:POR5638..scf222_8